MAFRKISERIYSVGVIDWDRRLFDELIPLPLGTSYNSYILKGSEKTVLIDSVDPSKKEEFLFNLNSLGISRIDYVVCQHAEQDHSGSIPVILERFSGSKVITNEKCKGLLIEHLRLKDEDFVIIKDSESVSLGDITLEFILAPWVHWPETMLTYVKEEKALFTCDMFGSHLATYNSFSDEDANSESSLKRYFAEIMMPFRSNIRKHLSRISSLELNYILPSHGPVHRDVRKIIGLYENWSSDIVKPLVLIPYVSMHDSTREMVEYLVSELNLKGLSAVPFNLSERDIGEFAIHLLDASTVVIATPTVLAGPHPIVAYATILMNALRPPTKYIGFIGSMGWGGKSEEILKSLLSNIKYQDVGSVFIKGCLKGEDKKRLSEFADRIREMHTKKEE
jgi:flavorubredoxin